MRWINKPQEVAIVGVHAQELKRMLGKRGFVFSGKPQLVFSFGGDGTILFSEKKFPGVPKLAVRFSSVCVRCGIGKSKRDKKHSSRFFCSKCVQKALDKIAASKRLPVREEIKLEGTAITKRTKYTDIALNEIQVHSRSPLHAIRGSLKVNGKTVFEKFISDGVLVSTPFGSTGYFYTVSRTKFEKGIGIALNNSTTRLKPRVVPDNSVVEIELTRRHGLFLADNHAKMVVLDIGDKVIVRKAKGMARFLDI